MGHYVEFGGISGGDNGGGHTSVDRVGGLDMANLVHFLPIPANILPFCNFSPVREKTGGSIKIRFF